jgi:glycosyltransferase involved in cell wall biosynthesis
MFRFLKIIQPVWYFNLKPAVDQGYFPDPESVRISMPQLEPDNAFSPGAALHELSYRAHRLGYLDTKQKAGTDWWQETRFDLVDEYRFIRKYFHITRVAYVFFFRLATFHNPFSEIAALWKSRGMSRFRMEDVHVYPPRYKTFDSELVKSQLRVTVIIPTLNRYTYLKDVLHDLEGQGYRNFDVIVVDQSDPYRYDFYADFRLDLRVIRQEEKALWLARNTAIQETDAPLLLLYDDDSRIAPDWIEQHLRCIDFFNAGISSGVSVSKTGAPVPANYRFFRWSDQLDTGNVMIRKEVFRQVGLFDRQFEKQRMGDGEFGLRSYLAGVRNISNPLASRLHLKVGEGGLREMGNWDAFRPKSFWSPRPVPSVFYLYRKYHGNRQAFRALLLQIFPSLVPYRFKGNRVLLLTGSLLALLATPLVAIQVFRSWRISGRMLQSGKIQFPGR